MDALRCRVKAAAVANLTDARYFAALGVDYLGFALEPGARGAVGELQVAAFREWIEGPALVGEFGHLPTDAIARQADSLALDVVQVGTFGDCGAVASASGRPVLQELALGGGLDIEAAHRIIDANAAHVQAFILDFARAGLHWDRLQEDPAWMRWLEEVCADYPVLLDVPAAPEQVVDILRGLNPEGLQLTGGEEEAVGLKSFAELDEWFEVLQLPS